MTEEKAAAKDRREGLRRWEHEKGEGRRINNLVGLWYRGRMGEDEGVMSEGEEKEAAERTHGERGESDTVERKRECKRKGRDERGTER